MSAAMLTEAQAQRLWLSLPDISDKGLAKLDVDRAAALRAGGLAWARITTAGRAFDFDRGGIPAVIQPVWRGPAPSIECGVEHPCLANLIGWRPAEPGRWWYRWGCDSPALGDEYLDDAHQHHHPLVCYSTPLDWLQNGCVGCVLLNIAQAYGPESGRVAA